MFLQPVIGNHSCSTFTHVILIWLTFPVPYAPSLYEASLEVVRLSATGLPSVELKLMLMRILEQPGLMCR